MKTMMCQINPTVGDFKGNLQIIEAEISSALQEQCDVVLFPEMAICGYPPRDLLCRESFWTEHDKALDRLFAFLHSKPQITVIVGGLHQVRLTHGRHARYNAAWILDKHFGRRVVHKRLLPCYDVFDETRYFSSDPDQPYRPIDICLGRDRDKKKFVACDVLICEDIWNHRFKADTRLLPASYDVDPISELRGEGPLFILNASPFWMGKIQQTQTLLEDISSTIGRPVFWCNQVGAHDDLVFGGYSMAVMKATQDKDQILMAQTMTAKAFAEDRIIVAIGDTRTGFMGSSHDLYDPSLNGKKIEPEDYDLWTMYQALRLHLIDYCKRTGFKTAVLGLSGGIDSAVVAVIAAHALGSENIAAIAMPSPYSAPESTSDAEELARNLKIYFEKHDITELYRLYQSHFLSGGKQKFDNPVTDENFQPRIRATLLMGYSNEFNNLLITTGNKSEIAVGYCTLYGDMAGGLGMLSDVWKTEVFALAKFINKYFDNVIPQNTIDRPPSAELKADQVDIDSLPPYETLDPILKALIEEEMSVDQILNTLDLSKTSGEAFTLVKKIDRMYRINEFKRQQMPIGCKLQHRSFGSGRRVPIAMKLTSA